MDPHVTKSNEESQGNTVTNKAATHSTPVDPDNQLTKPDKDIDQKDAGYGEVDTPATIKANPNNPEILTTMLMLPQEEHSMEDTATGLYTEELTTPQNRTKSLLTTKPPVLPENTVAPDNATTKDNVYSIVSINEDENDTAVINDRKQQRHHHYQHPKEEEHIAILPEHQDGAAVQVIKTPTPTQQATDGLCIGISSSKASLSPPYDSSMTTVLWVHPQSPLVCNIVLSQGYGNNY